MTQHGMGDEATIKKIISKVDTDNVLKFLMERNSVNALHGHVTSGTLILQDCAVSLLFALLPVLGGTSGVLQGVTYMTKSAIDAHIATNLFNLMSNGEILQAASYHDLLASSQEFQDLVNAHKETAGFDRLMDATSSQKNSNSAVKIRKTYVEKQFDASKGD
ncbi:K(+) efflux antiporter [Arachis hypogaea]|nr:K(+) efflux antiporter [Arachis hypogaea]